MLIQSDITYKSIDPIQPPLVLPDFIILSGINGSGKTHLLRGIIEDKLQILENSEELYPIKFVDHDTLRPDNNTPAHSSSYLLTAQRLFKSFSEYQDQGLDDIQEGIGRLQDDNPLKKILPLIARNAGKKINELNEGDFFKYYPLETGSQQRDIFQHELSNLFRRYYDRRQEHTYHKFLTEHEDISGHPFLSDEDFLKVYGEPPWVLLNKIIEEANLPYYLIYPLKLYREVSFELKLRSKINGVEINFSDLSSGEQVIMSLALALYNAKFEMEFPKLLLMDEPDAHLHPSMTKQFLDVIQNIFVVEKGMKVIMTTHSPSTVALAPEESLFIMNKTSPRITKASKDTALRILTAGVPTLSINYENRRQVFVEGKTDVIFYEKIYEKLGDKLIPEISINFISFGVEGVGGCELVKSVVNQLAAAGSHSIYGIIDYANQE